MRPPPQIRVRLPHVVVVPLLHRVAIVVAVLLRLVAPLRRRLRALCQSGGGDRHRKDRGSNERLHAFSPTGPNDPTRRHFVSIGAMCNAQYFETAVKEFSKKTKVFTLLRRFYTRLMRRKIYTHNEAAPAAGAE